jgi:molybdopterin/thiamine biosynthesis adenylyltransferase
MSIKAKPRQAPLLPKVPAHAAIKLVGLGGVGAIIARYGGLFLASPALDCDARLVLIDGDEYEPGNSRRMFFKTCGNKAAIVRAELLEYLADSRLTILAVESYLTADNMHEFLHDGDVVILAVDNHRTRKLVSDYVSTKLNNVCLISAGNDPVGPDSSGRVSRGTYGNCQVYIRQDRCEVTSPLTRWHPEIENPTDRAPNEVSCAEMAVSTPQILFANLMAASAALNALYRYLCDGPIFGEVAFDVIDAVMRPVPLPNPAAARRRQNPVPVKGG